MFFINEEHEKNFSEMLFLFPLGEQNYQYRIGCYVTAHPDLFTKVRKYIEGESPVYWAYMLEENTIEVDLTSGERLLVDMMLNLWNGTEGFDLNRALGIWDEDNYEMFLQAIRIARGQ